MIFHPLSVLMQCVHINPSYKTTNERLSYARHDILLLPELYRAAVFWFHISSSEQFTGLDPIERLQTLPNVLSSSSVRVQDS